MIQTIEVEGRKLEVYSKDLLSSDFVVFDNKIWRWYSKQGIGKNYTISLERPKTKEITHVHSDRYNEILWILKPTGHIDI